MRMVKLIPKLPFRIIMEDDIIHSDTLFSSLINNMVMLYNKNIIERFLNYFMNSEIIISSMFLGLNINRENEFLKQILFFPKLSARIYPFEQVSDKEESEEYDLKKAKKIKFVSLKVLKEILKNWDSGEEFFKYDLLNLPTFSEKFCFFPSEVPLNNEPDRKLFHRLMLKEKFISRIEEPKISGPRFKTEVSDLFSQEETELKEISYGKLSFKPFMFFLIQDNILEEEFKILNATIRLLCDEGIGPKRRTGKGIFDNVQIESLELHKSGELNINLSLIFPDESDKLNNILSYNFIKRGGYIYSNVETKANSLLKSKIRMFVEGSIFKEIIKGKLIDVSPINPSIDLNHKIYRYGINFPLYFGGENEI